MDKIYTEDDLREAFYKGREQAVLPDEKGSLFFIRPTFQGYLRELDGKEDPHENWKIRVQSVIDGKDLDLREWETMTLLRGLQKDFIEEKKNEMPSQPESDFDRNVTLHTIKITTGMGKCFERNKLSFLTDSEFDEFNVIGYTRKNSNGKPMGRQEYLNSLGKGEFTVTQTRRDNGDFSEEFRIDRLI
jgi:hypothetical protein